jgi:hypothetical protein
LEPVNESIRGRKTVLILELLTTILIPFILFVLFSGMELSVWFKIFIPILFFFMEIGAVLVVQFAFSKSMGAISLYSNGLGPPRA